MFPATPLPPTPEHLKAAERTPEGHADLSCVVILSLAQLNSSNSSRLTGTHKIRSEVMYKLAAFTVAMVLLPIGTYFLTRDHVFSRAYSSCLSAAHAPSALR